jgi:hypothetical protein
MSRGPGRPELYPIKKLLRFDQQTIDAIDQWRHQQEPAPNESDAIRSLVQLGLSRTKPATATSASKPRPSVKPRRAVKRKEEP